VAPTAVLTATPVPAALRMVPLRLTESPLPPPAPTPDGLPASRGTPTPVATAEAAWKYLTIVFAIENISDTARLVGIGGGGDPNASNLAAASLTARDNKRYKAVSSYSSFGWRTAVARSLAGYPVLLRLPPGFRTAAESFAGYGTSTAQPNTITFKIPATLTDYGTLTVPPPMMGGKSTGDEVAPKLRALIGPLEPLDLGAMRAGDQQVTFPTAAQSTPSLLAIGTPVSGPGKLVVTLSGVEVSDPADYQIRAKGWKEVAFTLRYRNADPDQPHAFTASAWFFGQDGVVYSGDVPAIGDFGRALTVPDPAVLITWDGRAAGSDQIGAGQERDRPPLRFLVPRALQDGILVLGGDVEAFYNVVGLRTPPQQ
jgi:hypothetical protein